MTSYSQRDKRWANKVMAPSKQIIGRVGCTTTCIADIATYFKMNLNPAQVADRIKYTKDGLILWQYCKFEKFEWWFRAYKKDDTQIRNALADPKGAVLFEINNGAHWVVGTGIDGVNKTYKIADPINGDRSTMKRYDNKLTGMSFFRGK